MVLSGLVSGTGVRLARIKVSGHPNDLVGLRHAKVWGAMVLQLQI